MVTRRRVFSSSIGTKIVIGTTGLALFLYLVIHLAGNLLVFGGPDVFNQYSYTLTSNPLIPVIEIGLLLVFLIHVYKAVTMYLANVRARPVRYVKKAYAGPPSRKSLASSTMIFSGLWLLVFVIIHVKAFKYGPNYEVADPSGAAGAQIHDLYRVEMENFSNPLTVAFYLLTMIVVGSHLWHGVASGFQSLGVLGDGGPGDDSPRWASRMLLLGKTLAVVIATGFIAIALWAYFAGAGA
jgi:succinate dehydrogenase / fumarate reductase cytochrome b subunit